MLGNVKSQLLVFGVKGFYPMCWESGKCGFFLMSMLDQILAQKVPNSHPTPSILKYCRGFFCFVFFLFKLNFSYLNKTLPAKNQSRTKCFCEDEFRCRRQLFVNRVPHKYPCHFVSVAPQRKKTIWSSLTLRQFPFRCHLDRNCIQDAAY